MKLYTVDRGRYLKEGTTIALSHNDPFELPFLECYGLFSSEQLSEHLKKLYPNGLSSHGWGYLKGRHTTGVSGNYKHDTLAFIEMILEEVRKGYFPDKLSRFQSLFASGSLGDATLFRNKYGEVDSPIFEFEALNSLRLDMSYLYLGTQNITGSFLAHQYWKGEATTNPFWEYLAELPIIIGKQVA